MRSALLFFILISLGGSLHARARQDYTALIRDARTQASPAARKVLSIAHRMVQHKTIIRGSCWDYLNAAFSRAGFPPTRRKTVFRHSKSGPYANANALQPGDWLYYINHGYGGVEHSGLFIGWINHAHKKGLILSYGGEHRNKPGRYRSYDLRSVYQITRAQ